jgi:hypothetical protein
VKTNDLEFKMTSENGMTHELIYLLLWAGNFLVIHLMVSMLLWTGLGFNSFP